MPLGLASTRTPAPGRSRRRHRVVCIVICTTLRGERGSPAAGLSEPVGGVVLITRVSDIEIVGDNSFVVALGATLDVDMNQVLTLTRQTHLGLPSCPRESPGSTWHVF